MSRALPVLHLSIWIDRDLATVAAFLREPANFPLWATGLAKGLKPAPGQPAEARVYLAAAPEGELLVRFSPPNDFGVADHWVTLPDGREISIPLRAVANGTGSEVTLTLFRLPEMTDEIQERDRDWVLRDLARLKRVIEEQTSRG